MNIWVEYLSKERSVAARMDNFQQGLLRSTDRRTSSNMKVNLVMITFTVPPTSVVVMYANVLLLWYIEKRG
jgi:hypothetical protein